MKRQNPRPGENQAVGGGFFKGTIPDVKTDPVASQEMKQRIEIAQMNITIRQMQNEITRLRRNDNYVLNPRMSAPEQRRNSAPEQRMRFENVDNQQRQRVPRQPTQNAVILDEPYNEQMIEPENDFFPEEVFESVQTDGCETSMYISEEDEEDPISQENISQTRAHVNKAKNKEK
jgi:hypothetical protein